MSGHADTIRRELKRHTPDVPERAFAALDALLAENQRLREAHREIAEHDYLDGDECRRIAREALAGDTE